MKVRTNKLFIKIKQKARKACFYFSFFNFSIAQRIKSAFDIPLSDSTLFICSLSSGVNEVPPKSIFIFVFFFVFFVRSFLCFASHKILLLLLTFCFCFGIIGLMRGGSFRPLCLNGYLPFLVALLVIGFFIVIVTVILEILSLLLIVVPISCKAFFRFSSCLVYFHNIAFTRYCQAFLSQIIL